MTTSVRADAPTARVLLPASASYEEWQATRRTGIGGSDVAAILGLGDGKYTSPRHVYEAKHGRDKKRDTEAMEFGREMEPVIASIFSRRAGVPVATPPGMLVNVERPFMLANVDRYGLDPVTGAVVAPIELKNRSEYQLDAWEDGVPDAPAIQCHWYMAVGGWSHGYVAGVVGGNKLRWSRLERDEEMIGYLVDYCGTWYQRHVVEGFPPPADGYEATTNLLAKLWSVKAETIAEIDVAKARKLRALRADLKEQEKALAEQIRTVENEMRLLTGTCEVAKAGGKQAWSWKLGNFAPKQFREAEPELAEKYTRMMPALDVDALKDEEPEVYAKYRGRTLRVPAKGV